MTNSLSHIGYVSVSVSYASVSMSAVSKSIIAVSMNIRREIALSNVA